MVEKQINYIPARYIFAVLLTLFEVLCMIGIVVTLCYYVPYFYLLCWVTEIVCIINVIASDDNPDYKVPWLLFIMILPIAGFMLYFLFYSRRLPKKYIKRLKAVKRNMYILENEELWKRLHLEDKVAYNQATLLCKTSDCDLFGDTEQTYFSSGELMWQSMLRDLKSAERFIFMEYFIIKEGEFWGSIYEILKAKSALGVEVYLVYDDIGCMSTLPGNYAKKLRKDGIKGVPFSRLKGNADGEFNNRSHRKIAVIDGFIAYTGGVNLADEYINRIQPFGYWKDVGIRLEGCAVWGLTRLFLIDYGINAKAIELPPEVLYPKQNINHRQGYLIPFGDGPNPLYTHRVGKGIIQSMVESANEYVYVTTPYLIIDNDLCQCFENAALKGIDVRIIVPHIPDKKIIFSMTRSFYTRLMAAGVKVYEYKPGFIHAKMYIADGKYGMIGTINLDYRSLVHHFENGIWMYNCEAVTDMRRDVESILEQCIPIKKEELQASLLQRLFRSLVRIFAPLL